MPKDRKIAVVGAGGFIGSHLSASIPGALPFFRSNLHNLEQQDPDELIIAAAPGLKWKANDDPISDLNNLEQLIDSLRRSAHRRCILISTIDVFPTGTIFNEASCLPEFHPEGYGRNRGFLERRISELFSELKIIRLPGMFGPGLRKNFLFDYIHKKVLPNFGLASTFQFYDIRDLCPDIEKIRGIDSKHFNFATEPIRMKQIYDELFDIRDNSPDGPIINYDMRTIFAKEISSIQGNYFRSAKTILSSINTWVEDSL